MSQKEMCGGAIRRTGSLAIILAVFAPLPASAQKIPEFSGGVSLVHVDAEVLGQNGRPQTGLGAEDFRILDAGQEQSIIGFSEGEQPLDLVLLFDISGSMRKQVRKVAGVAQKALGELRPGDRVCVMAFNTEAKVLAPFSENLDVATQGIHRLLKTRFGGGTYIIDSIGEAANKLIWYTDADDQRRRAVLVLTDNVGKPSMHERQIRDELWESNALLSALVVHDRVSDVSVVSLLSPFGAKRFGTVNKLVEKTGGDLIRTEDLSTAFPEAMHRIRCRYTLYYRLPKGEPDSVRTTKLELSPRGRQRCPAGRVLARTGYRLQHDQHGFAQR